MALSTARLTRQRKDGDYNNLVVVGQKTATTLYVGGIVCTDATGFAVPGATASGLKIMGVLTSNQPWLSPANSFTNSGASGSQRLNVLQGTFAFKNSGTDPVAQADVGATVYIEDDETIAKTASGKSAAGRFIELDPVTGECWVTVIQQ